MWVEAAWHRHGVVPLSLSRHESGRRWNFWKSSILVEILIRRKIPPIWEMRIPTQDTLSPMFLGHPIFLLSYSLLCIFEETQDTL